MSSSCAFGSGRVSWLMSVTEPLCPSSELAGVPPEARTDGTRGSAV